MPLKKKKKKNTFLYFNTIKMQWPQENNWDFYLVACKQIDDCMQ